MNSFKCNNCQKDVQQKMSCARCNLVSYCSKECQVTDWPSHKKICVKTPTPTRKQTGDIIYEHPRICELSEGLIFEDGVIKTVKKFKQYREVLKESPLIMYLNDNQYFYNFLDQFVNSPKEVQLLILDMRYIPVDNKVAIEVINPFKSQFEKIIKLYPSYPLNEDSIKQLLLILHTNSIEFHNHQQIVIGKEQPKYSALFQNASRVSHSCNPNCYYSGKDTDGFLRFYAIREIRKNQPITFSPVNNYEWSREERRLNLLEERNINCQCERCLGPDDNRGIKCLKILDETKKERCWGVMFRTESLDAKTHEWKCNKCAKICDDNDPQIQAGITQENAIKLFMEAEKKNIEETADLQKINKDVIQKMYKDSSRILSNTHYLMINILLFQNKILSNVCEMLEAYDMAKKDKGYVSNKNRAIESGKLILQSIECQQKGCTGVKNDGTICDQLHEPTCIFTDISQYLYQQTYRESKHEATIFGERYLKVLKLTLGEKDKDVVQIEELIKNKK